MATSKIQGTIDTGWKTLKNGIVYRKVGSIVYVQIEALTPAATSGTELLGTLPQGYRPSLNVQPFIRKGAQILQAWITDQGNINVTATTSPGVYAGFVSFAVNN